MPVLLARVNLTTQSTIFQNEKNQIMKSNVWLRLVSTTKLLCYSYLHTYQITTQ